MSDRRSADVVPTVRRPLAEERAAQAREAMRDCRLCAHDCGADRTQGTAGFCRADATARVFQERVDWGGEQRLAPTLVINLSGCNLRCGFCITGAQSQNARAGRPLDLAALSSRLPGQTEGLRSVTLEGGEVTIHLGAALEIASRVPSETPLVWKTNAYASEQALDLLDGIPDYVLADYKFGNDECAQRLAGVPDYTAAVRRNLHWARGHSKLIVRHLLMPGHLDCCFRPVARWLSESMPDIPFSLMDGFLPLFRSKSIPGLRSMTSARDAATARKESADLGLQLEPWIIGLDAAEPAPPAAAGNGDDRPDEIWIDRNGRLCVGFASAALLQCLNALPEFELE